jgi:hypothetical protein
VNKGIFALAFAKEGVVSITNEERKYILGLRNNAYAY